MATALSYASDKVYDEAMVALKRVKDYDEFYLTWSTELEDVLREAIRDTKLDRGEYDASDS